MITLNKSSGISRFKSAIRRIAVMRANVGAIYKKELDLRRLRIAIIGMTRKAFQELVRTVKLAEIELLYGGCIDDGSNSAKLCNKAARKADVVLINTQYARYLGKGLGHDKAVINIRGVSSAKEAINKLCVRA